jgi:SAM-dependent methyltransferase
MDASYGERYASLYRRHWWWRARERFLLRVLDRRLSPGAAGHVLDFGCGDGLFLDKLARYGAPQGIETDERLLTATGPWRSKISTDPLREDRTQHGRYGLIVALDVLEHIAEPLPVMAELTRRLRPGGLFVATVPAFQQLWTAHDVVNQHVKRYTVADASVLVASSGLEVQDARYFFTWLALLKWMVVQKERFVAPVPAPPALPVAPVNALLLGAAYVEQALVGEARPSFGSSVLVVAQAPVSRDAPPSP